MRKLGFLTLVALGAALGQGAELQVLVRNSAEVDQADAPVTLGVPWPAGALRAVESLRLLDRTGAARPLQAEVLSRWPDGSAKWALLDFQATVPRRGLAFYRLASGAAAAPEGPPAAIAVQDAASYISVSTGAATFRVPKDRFTLFDEVKLAGQEQPVVAPHNEWDGLSLELAGEAGGAARPRTFLSSRGPAKAEVETSGPVRAVVRVAGKLQTEGGATWGDYVARLHFYAGRATARLQLTVFSREKPPAGAVADLTVRLPLRSEGLLKWEFAGERGRLDTHPGSLRNPADEAALVQRAAGSRAACRYALVQRSQTQASGGLAGGGVSLWGATGGAAVAVRSLAETNPKALRVRGMPRIEMGILPREAGPCGELLPGRAVSCDVLMAFAAGAPPSPAAVAAAFDAPLAACVAGPGDAAGTGQWYAASGALSLAPLGTGEYDVRFPDDLARLQQAIDGAWGMWSHGAPLSQGCDATLALAREFLRRGEPRLLGLAEAGARHLASALRLDPEASWCAGAWRTFLLTGDRAILDGVLVNAASATRRAYDPDTTPLAAALAALNLTYAADVAPRFAPENAAAFETALDLYAGKLLDAQRLGGNGLPDDPVANAAVALEALAGCHARKPDPRIPPAILRAAEALARPAAFSPEQGSGMALAPALPWLAFAAEATGDFRFLAKARRIERVTAVFPVTSALDFALRYRGGDLFAAAWERRTEGRRATDDPAIGLLCRLECAAEVSLPAQGVGGCAIGRPFVSLPDGTSACVVQAPGAPEQPPSGLWFPLADSPNVAETQGAITFRVCCRRGPSEKGATLLLSGDPRTHGFALTLGRKSLELLARRENGASSRVVGNIRLAPGAWHRVALTWAPGPRVALFFDGQQVGLTRAGRLGLGPHLQLPCDPKDAESDILVRDLCIWRRPPAAFPVAQASSLLHTGKMPVPPAVADLLLAPGEEGKVLLSWTAPGGDGKQGRARRYHARVATRPFRALSWGTYDEGGEGGTGFQPVAALAQWAEAERLLVPFAPEPAGQLEKLLIGPLPKDLRVYVALRSEDDAGNLSPLSNVVQTGPNHAPSADAGPPLRQAIAGATVLFDGRGSSDPDGDELTYEWSNGLKGPVASLRCDRPGTSDITLTVSDGRLTATAVTRLAVGDAIRVNFQPRRFPRTPEGFVADEGAAYSRLRGYGWRAVLSGVRGLVRREPAGLAVEAATGLAFQGPAEWLCDLSNGSYKVTLALGAGKALVEGREVPPNADPAARTIPVAIADGQLNLRLEPSPSLGPGPALDPQRSEINYILIERQ